MKGVTQGSILGPLLFTIFVNDLPDAADHCTVNLYADDSAIYTSNKDPCGVSTKLEGDLRRVDTWINANKLKTNVAKTQLMVLYRRRNQWKAQSVEVRIDGDVLVKQECVQYIGVRIDKYLDWKLHIQSVHHKCLAQLAAIRRAGS